MKLSEKQQKLNAIKQEFQHSMSHNGKVENVGTVFFLYYAGACVLRDVVYYRSIHHGLLFETLCMTSSYFVGSKEHAESLKEAYGGTIYSTEYSYLAKNSQELWVWEGPKRQEQLETEHRRQEVTPLDLDEIKTILF